MRLNRKWMLVIALVVSMATAISGTLAYLTSTDSATNTFTVGNVSIDLQEPDWDTTKTPTLLPGVEIAKDPQIVNTGSTEAWVWMKITVPTDLMSYIDWNTTAWTMTDDDDADNDGNTIVTLKRATKLPAGETTAEAFTKVALPADLDKMPESLGTGTVDIVVNAYAIQSDAATNIDDAIAAYGTNSEGGEPGEGGNEPEGVVTVSTVDGLKAALLEGKNIILANDLDLTGTDLQQMDAAVGATSQSMFSLIGDKNVTINLNGKTITADTTGGNNVWTIFYAGQDANLTVKNGRIEFNSKGRTGGTSAFTTFGSNSVITINDIEVEQIGEGGVTQMIYAHGAPQDLGKIYVEGGTYIQKEPTSATNPFYEQGGYNTNIIVSGGTYKVYHDVDLTMYMTMADGYKLELIRADDDGANWYEVVHE